MTLGTVAQLRRAFAAPAADRDTALFVAEDAGGDVVGFVYLVVHEDFFTLERHGHVSEVAVVRDGAGTGRLLMAAAETYFRDLGVRFVTLNVNEGNARAQRFYERLGYAPQLRQFVKVL